MARPVETDKKRELARAAVEILQREGLELSMAELADRLGMKRPTLLYHFPTKAEIVALALVDLLTEQAAWVVERVEQHEHPIDRLYAHVRAVHAFHAGREARIVFLTQAIAASSGQKIDEFIAIGNQVFAMQRQAAVERLREGIRAGTVAPCDPEALMATVRALVDGLMVQRVMTGIELAPVHALVWERLLLPLKRTPDAAPAKAARDRRSPRRTRSRPSPRPRRV
ncbi:TetR family transcriptional regulator [Myxococcota bacterium]|nr:TetR family transcriptional regulator [Myxococcota bacterium]